MSIEAMTLVLHHSKASATDKVILWGIANHLGDGGAYPSLETLAKYANVSVRSVSRSIAQLIELGELESKVNGAPIKGINKSNLYYINLRCPAECDGTMNHRIATTDLTKGTTDLTSRVVNNDIPATTDMSTEPLTKPLREPLKEPITKKPHLLDESWLPDDRLVEMFRTKWPLLNMSEQTELFRLHHMARGNKMADWGLAYQKWMNQAQKWAAEKQPAQPSRKIVGDF